METSLPSGRTERRRHPRIPLDWPVTIALDDGTFPARLRDVSRAGMCFFLDRRVPEMTILRMDLELPPAPGSPRAAGEPAGERVTGSGVVVRCQPLSKHVDHYEIAVFLNDLSEDARARIEGFVARYGG
jgi:hypothetical protein